MLFAQALAVDRDAATPAFGTQSAKAEGSLTNHPKPFPSADSVP